MSQVHQEQQLPPQVPQVPEEQTAAERAADEMLHRTRDLIADVRCDRQ